MSNTWKKYNNMLNVEFKRMGAFALSILIVFGGVHLFFPFVNVSGEIFSVTDVRVDDAVTDNWDETDPDIAVNSTGCIFVAFVDNIYGDNDIFIAKSTDGGASFSGVTRVNDDPIGSGSGQDEPAIAIDGNDKIYVAWRDNRWGGGADTDIAVSNSTDGGTTWGDGLLNSFDVRINDDGAGGRQRELDMAIDNTDVVFVVWADNRWGGGQDYDIFISNSSDGAIWGDGVVNDNDIRINDDAIGSGDRQREPAIAIDSTDKIYVAWSDNRWGGGGDYDIAISNSTDSGAIWGDGVADNDVRINDDPVGLGNIQGNPAIAVNGTDAVFAVWTDDRDGDDDILVSSSTDGVTWGDGVINSNDEWINDDGFGNAQTEPAIAIDNTDMIFVVWSDDRLGDNDIFTSYSTNGTFWGDGLENDNDTRINDDGIGNGLNQQEPAIAVDNLGSIFAVWSDERKGNLDIFCSQSPNGMTWGDGVLNDNDIQVARPGTPTSDQVIPEIAVFGANLYAVWQDYRDDVFGGGDSNIYFTNSTDGGASWGDGVLNHNDIRVDDSPQGTVQEQPDMGVDFGGNIYVVWQDDRDGDWDIYFSYSTDGGTTWGDGLLNNNDVRINDDGAGNIQQNPSIAVAPSGAIYVVWQDDRDGDLDIYFSYSTDGGTTWGDGFQNNNDVRINDDAMGNGLGQLDPSISANSTSIFVVWSDERNGTGDWDIFLSYSTDGGGTWGDGIMDNNNDVRINDDGAANIQQSPDIDISGNAVYVVWSDDRNGDLDILSSYSSDGVIWGDGQLNNNDVRINNDMIGNGLGQLNPRISADGIGIYVVWSYERNAGGDWDVFFSKSLNGGLSWSAPNDRVDNPPAAGSLQQFPSLAINSTDIFVVWQDNRDNALNGFDIYFSKSTRIEPSKSALRYVFIIPSGPTDMSIGQIQSFTAYGINYDDSLNTTWTPTWDTTDGLGTVIDTGGSAATGWTADYTAGGVVGMDNITVANGTVTNQSQINIIPTAGPLYYIVITPSGPVTLNPTDIQSYTALGYDQFGVLNTTWTATWGTTNGLGGIVETGGSAATGWTADYTAGTAAGMDNITVANGTVTNSSQIDIIPGPLFRIELIPWPGPVTLNLNGVQPYIAFGYDQFGNLNVTWTPSWGTTDSLGGVVETGGSAATGWTANYTAGTVAGADNITVVNGTATNSSQISIIPGPLFRIELTPPGPIILNFNTVQFYTAFGY
ncbi:MAG: exo-alpha-sialidase, partial [Thermoplasmata archaeon]